jgi:hypothetical protein
VWIVLAVGENMAAAQLSVEPRRNAMELPLLRCVHAVPLLLACHMQAVSREMGMQVCSHAGWESHMDIE